LKNFKSLVKNSGFFKTPYLSFGLPYPKRSRIKPELHYIPYPRRYYGIKGVEFEIERGYLHIKKADFR